MALHLSCIYQSKFIHIQINYDLFYKDTTEAKNF